MLKNPGSGKTCDRCGKGHQVLMNVSHSHKRTNTKSFPNLHKTTLTISGVTRQFRFCTKCLRLMKQAFGKVHKQAEKIVEQAQTAVVETPVITQEDVQDAVSTVETVEETVTEEAEEEKPKKKAKKTSAGRKKAARESSRKKSLTDLISDDEDEE